MYIPTAAGKILLNSVVMVLAFGARGHWFESCPDLKCLPCVYSFSFSLLQTLFIRGTLERLKETGRIADRPKFERLRVTSQLQDSSIRIA